MPEELEDAILENAQGPESATADGVSVRQHPLTDQIEAAKFLEGKDASFDPAACLARRKIVLPGPV